MSADIEYNSTGTFNFMYQSANRCSNHQLLVARPFCNKLHQRDGHFSILSSEEEEKKDRNKQESKVVGPSVTYKVS